MRGTKRTRYCYLGWSVYQACGGPADKYRLRIRRNKGSLPGNFSIFGSSL